MTPMKSFLENRMQIVEVDGFRTNPTLTPPCSCIQGSKLAGIFYNLYTNEIPLLPTLMNTDIMRQLTDSPNVTLAPSEHTTVNFVDDSNNVIGFTDSDNIKTYLETFYCLLQSYYHANKLIINADKTKFTVNFKPKRKMIYNDLSFKAGNFIITAKPSIKLLGK